MRVIFFAVFTFMLVSLSVSAQSNETIDFLLAEESLSAGSAAYLLLSAVDRISDDASRAEALSSLKSYPFAVFLADMGADDEVTLGEFAYLAQNLFELPKGIMSGIFPGPRYAVRDLRFLGMIQGRAAAGNIVSGERAGRIVVRILTEKERRS